MSENALKHIRFPALAVIIGGAFALRFNLAAKAFFSTFDTSTVGVMALRILQEGERPLFYYGQDYMGALEAYTASLFFALFGPSTTVLSLAPTLYALGWVLAMYLLFAGTFGTAGGLAAALSAAACGWYPLWFTMAAYGGYPETLFFGTLFLWLVVRICFRDGGDRGPFLPAAAAGAVAALGIWTNYQVLSYLAAGGLAAAAVMTDREKRRRLFMPFVVTAVIALAGFGPLAAERLGPDHGTDQYAGEASVHLATNVSMFTVAMKRHFSWPVKVLPGLRQGALVAFAGALALCLFALPGITGKKKEVLVPLLFLAVFPVLFLLHPKAATGATRYTIPLMSMATGLFFAGAVSAQRQYLRAIGWTCVAAWTVFNVLSAAATAEAKRDEAEAIRASRYEIAAAAGELGLRHVEIVGSEIDGLNGQTLTFFSRDKVRFTAILNERHLPSAEGADGDDGSGLFCKKEHFEKVADSLHAAGVSFRYRKVAGRVILHEIVPSRRAVHAVPAGEMEVATTGGAGTLTDRIESTGISFAPGEGAEEFEVEVTFPRRRTVAGLRLHSRFPSWAAGSFHVSGSMDGRDFFPLAEELKQSLPVSSGGSPVLIMRPRNPVELRFPPREVRFLRLRVRPAVGGRTGWHLGELFILEDGGDGTAVTEGEVAAIRRSLQEKNIDFCAADRWLSARLQGSPGGPAVYRRYNERYPATRRSRGLALRPGLAIAVDESLADETAAVLAAALPPGLSLEQERHGHYRLFTFGGAVAAPAAEAPALTWSEVVVLRKDAPSSDREER